MRVVRVGELPDETLEAAAEFYARVLPLLSPPQDGEGDDAQHRGGGSPPGAASTATPHHHAASRRGPPPRAREDLVIILRPAPYDHRAWRLAAIQDLARAAAPTRVNGVVGHDEGAIAETLVWLEAAPGVTGQLLAVEPG